MKSRGSLGCGGSAMLQMLLVEKVLAKQVQRIIHLDSSNNVLPCCCFCMQEKKKVKSSSRRKMFWAAQSKADFVLDSTFWLSEKNERTSGPIASLSVCSCVQGSWTSTRFRFVVVVWSSPTHKTRPFKLAHPSQWVSPWDKYQYRGALILLASLITAAV